MAIDPKMLAEVRRTAAEAVGVSLPQGDKEPSAVKSAIRGLVEGESDMTLATGIVQSYAPSLYATKDPELKEALQGGLLSAADRRTAANRVTQAQIDNQFWDTPPEGVAYQTASIVKSLASPTTLAPVGKGYAAATAIGAGLGAEYEILRGINKENDIDVGSVATKAAIGGISAAAFTAVFGPAAAAEARLLTQEGGDLAKVRGALTEEAPTPDPFLVDMPTAAARLSPDGYRAEIKMQNALGERVPTKEFDDNMYRVAQADAYLAAPDKKVWRFQNPAVIKMLNEPKDAFHTLQGENIGDKFLTSELLLKKTKDIAKKGGKRGKRQVAEKYDAKIADLAVRIEKSEEILNRGFQEVMPPRSKLWEDIVSASTFSKNSFSVAHLPDSLKAKRAIENGDIPRNHPVSMKMFPPEGKMSELDALLDGAVDRPNVLERLMNKLGGSQYLRRPTAEMSQTSVSGKMIAEGLEEGYLRTNSAVAESMYEFKMALRSRFIDANTPEELQVVGLLNKTLSTKGLSADVIDAAADLEKQFKGILKSAYDTKVIDQDTYKKLLARGKEKGYFPRVYDEELLNSKEGREQFAEALAAVKFKPEDALLLAKTITKENNKALTSFINSGIKADGSIRFNKNSLIALLKARGKTLDEKRSSHLEKPRKLPESLEKILDPFLIRDAQGVLSKYYQDVHGRIEYAKVFGADDEAFEYLYKDLLGRNHEVGERAWETYNTAVRSHSSETLQSFVKTPEAIRRIVGSIKSFETLKLMFAQVINLGQGVVNGTTLLTAKGGINPAEAYKISLKSMMDVAKLKGDSHLAEMIDRSGASLQNLIMQASGDMNQAYHTISGRELIAPFDILNNPTKFLKSTGFFHVENFNRSLAAVMGKNYADTLVLKRIKLLGQGPGKKFTKELAEVDAALKEMGIPPNFSKIDDVSQQSIRDAMQLFSNQVNFTNAAHNMPIATQSFFGKFAFQFKSFAYHHGVFIGDNVIGPAKRGNLVPLATYLGVGSPVGMTLDEFRRWIMGDDKEFTNTERWIRGVSSIGGIGLALDMVRGTQYGPEKAAVSMLGPGISDASRLAYGATQTVMKSFEQGEFVGKPLGREIVGSFVFPWKKQVMKSISEEKKAFSNPYKNPYK